METAEETKPTRGWARQLMRVGWAVLAVFGVMVLGNVGLVFVKLNQEVKPSEQAAKVMSITATTVLSDDPTTTTSAGWRVVSQPDVKTSITTMMTGNLLEPYKDDRYKLNARIEKVNAGYRATMKAYGDYLNDKPGLSREQARERLGKIQSAWWELLQNEYYGTKLMTFEKISNRTWKKIEAVDRVGYQLNLNLAVEHQEWIVAARICEQARMGWPAQVYYLQKVGPSGKAYIAQQTTKRYWTALASSVLSIGPDFHLPRFEDN